ncbi:MAG: methyltransferase domain-containing protein [Nitrospiraceae bacterium]|nr:MAG: methyltransferase domain-containing protein [Nitrospiraceae bacterium]
MLHHSELTFKDTDDYARLRDVLEKAGYTDKGVLEVIGVKDFPSMKGTDVQLLLRRTKDRSALNTLIRLFLIETECDTEAVKEAFHPLKPQALIEAGIVKVDGNFMTAAVKLMPYKNLYITFDLPCMLQSDSRTNYVMGIGSSTLTLANLTVRKPSRMTLDLGAGCGIHAFLAAGHSRSVIAADLNPRAVRFAEFNAKLNSLSNVQCLEGDLFGPVKGHKFDLVVSNPPFVISPEARYIYRDGGMEGDQITRKIVGRVPEFLNDGGYCQILCNWAELRGQDWKERLHKWFDGTGCDAWVLRSESLDAETYAQTWIRHTEKSEPGLFPEQFEKWMDYYESHGISSMGAGLITMRRSEGRASWFRADDAPERMDGPCGDAIVRGFGLRDFLETAADDSILLDSEFCVSPEARLERRSKPTPEGWLDESVRISLAKGLSYSGNIDHYIANMLINCDGRRKISELMNEMAQSLQAEPEKIKGSFCSIVRHLVQQGFLLPPGID